MKLIHGWIRHNRIQSIKNTDHTIVSSQTEKEAVFKDYIQQVNLSSNPSILDIAKGTQGVVSKLTIDMNNSPNEQFTQYEVMAALKQMAPLKSSD